MSAMQQDHEEDSSDVSSVVDSDDEMSDVQPEVPKLSPHEYKELGNAHYKKGEYTAAIAQYTLAIDGDPDVAAYRNNRAAAQMMLLDFSAALEDALAATKLEPQTVKFWDRAAKCYSSLGRSSDALRLYTHILENLDKNHATAKKEVGLVNNIKQLEQQAQSAIDGGHYNSAISMLERALGLAPGNDRAKMLQANAYIHLKNLGQADRIVSAILRKDSTNTEALYLRGICMYEKGELDRAVDHFKRALRGNPDHAKSRLRLKTTKRLADAKQQGNDAYKTGKYEDALSLYNEALEIDGENIVCSKLLCNKGLVLGKLGRHSEAVTAFTAALDVDQQYIKALSKRALAYIELEQFQEAINDCEKACDMDPSDRELRRNLEHAKLELKKSKRKNYYKILSVAKDADDNTIKKAYRKKAMKYHPDRIQGGDDVKASAEAKFKDVSEAYTVLSDGEKRRKYEAGQDIEEINGGGGGGGHARGYEDLFAQFSRGGGGGFSGFGGFPGGF